MKYFDSTENIITKSMYVKALRIVEAYKRQQLSELSELENPTAIYMKIQNDGSFSIDDFLQTSLQMYGVSKRTQRLIKIYLENAGLISSAELKSNKYVITIQKVLEINIEEFKHYRGVGAATMFEIKNIFIAHQNYLNHNNSIQEKI